MTADPLETRVARALRAALDAEGVVFGSKLPPVERLVAAHRRFQLDNPALMDEVREWYLDSHAPVTAPDWGARELSPDDHYLAVWLSEHEHFSVL
jgi:hypothetical protein